MHKAAVIGAGQVGATTALFLAQKGVSEIVLVDVAGGLARGKALDMMEASPIAGFDARIEATDDFSAIQGADVVVHTAGKPRTPGMDRMDLLKTNVGIAAEVSRHLVTYCPDARVVVVANPLDIICMAMLRHTGFAPQRIVGQAGVLDGARFRWFVAEELGVSPAEVDAMVLGGHGDKMVPLTSQASAGGVALSALMDDETIQRLVQRTRTGGGEIVQLLQTGSAFYAPAAAAAYMAHTILTATPRVMAASVLCEGQYGYRDMFLGLPVVLGGGGVERIIDIELTPQERTRLDASAEAVAEGVRMLDSL
jgi:malate dehydrogenase